MQRRRFFIGTAALAAALATGCTMTRPGTENTAAKKREIDAGINATLDRLYRTAEGSRELVNKARGVLVFPSVLSAGLIVGAEHGHGALRVGGKTVDYYQTTSGSFGFQAGAQSRAIVLLFMTEEALRNFRNSEGFTVGANATVALATVGADGTIDSNTIREPIIGFAMTNQGLMAGVSLEGSKITRLNW